MLQSKEDSLISKRQSLREFVDIDVMCRIIDLSPILGTIVRYQNDETINLVSNQSILTTPKSNKGDETVTPSSMPRLDQLKQTTSPNRIISGKLVDDSRYSLEESTLW